MTLIDQVDAVVAEHKIPYWKIGEMAGAKLNSSPQNKIMVYHRWRDKVTSGVVDFAVLHHIEKEASLPKGTIMKRFHGGSAEILSTAPKQFVPLLGAVSAAKSEWHPDEVQGWLPYPFLKDARKRIFGVQVDGDCMSPTVHDGDLVFIDKQFNVDDLNNKVVVVRVDGEDTTLKRFYKRENGIELRPDNGAYPSIFITEQESPEIVGVVVKKVGEV